MYRKTEVASTKLFSRRCVRQPARLRSLWLAALASVCLPIGHAGSLASNVPPGQEDQLATLTDIRAIRALTPEIANRASSSARSWNRHLHQRARAGGHHRSRRERRAVRALRSQVLPHASANRSAPRRRRRGGGLHDGRGICAGARSRGRPPARAIAAASSPGTCRTRRFSAASSIAPTSRWSASASARGCPNPARRCSSTSPLKAARCARGSGTFRPQDLTRFIDARVRLRGNAGTLYNQARQVRGVSLFAGRAADAAIETRAPEPWSLAVRAISSLYTHHAMDQLDRRVRVRGTVTGTQGRAADARRRHHDALADPRTCVTGSTCGTRPAPR